MSNNQYENQATFERCEHDRENPYTMIATQLIRDKSITPKSKGVLIYMLSFGKGWKFFHSQLQDGLGIGEDCLRSTMEELIKAGYADRTRERVKGVYQPYKYVIREFKKCIPNGVSQPGSASLENPVQSNINVPSINTSNINLLPPLTPPKENFEKQMKKEEDEDFSFLSKYNFTDHELKQLKPFSISQIQNALKIAGTQKIKQSLFGLLLNILRNPEKWPSAEDIKKSEEVKSIAHGEKIDLSTLNRSYWTEILKAFMDPLIKSAGTIKAAQAWHKNGLRECGSYLEQANGEKIYMKDASFLDQVENFFRKKDISLDSLYKFIDICKIDFCKQMKSC